MITVKQFLLKKFPTNEYMDCPVPKHHWETMQEYADEFHLEMLRMPAKVEEENELLNALGGILNNDGGMGCPMCDSGKLRNPLKEHWDNCVWNNARLIYEQYKK